LKYRYALMEGVLVRQRRSFLFWWRWVFNQSEEDEINRLKNELVIARNKVKQLARLLPKKQAKLDERKKALRQYMEASGKQAGPVWVDKLSFRREPVRLIEDVKLAKKKEDRKESKPEPVVLAQLTTAPVKQRR